MTHITTTHRTILSSVVADLGGASSDISKAVDDCKSGSSKIKCALDVVGAAADIGKAGIGIAKAVKACGGGNRNETKY